MKIVADECVDKEIVLRLRSDGHKVDFVAETSPEILDEDVLILAGDEDILLVTEDKDFGELVFRQGLLKRGILLYRLPDLFPLERAEIISIAIAEHENELLDAFSVLTEKSLRIRRLS